MFFRKKPKDDEDDSQFGELDVLVTSGDSPIADGIRRALERDDITPEDRREFEAALKRLQEQPPEP